MNKKLIVIACSERKKGKKCKDSQGNESYGFIERISSSDKLEKLESYKELTIKRQEILLDYNKKEFIKNPNDEKKAIYIYNGKQYENKFYSLGSLIIDSSFEYDMLIVSTLYGIVHFHDKIYPYEVKNMKVYWNDERSRQLLRKIILEYYKEKKFHSMHVFLSKTYFDDLGLKNWGANDSIFCHIAVDCDGKRLRSNTPEQLGKALYSFLKGTQMKDIVVCNPLEYDNYRR